MPKAAFLKSSANVVPRTSSLMSAVWSRSVHPESRFFICFNSFFGSRLFLFGRYLSPKFTLDFLGFLFLHPRRVRPRDVDHTLRPDPF